MRNIGFIKNESLARKFSDYLFVKKIENEVHHEDNGNFSIWVIHDEQMEIATGFLNSFLDNPLSSEYQKAYSQAQALRAQKKRSDAQRRSQFIDVRTHWHRYDTKIGPVTLGLIIICVVVALLTQLGSAREFTNFVYITQYRVSAGYLSWRAGLPEIFEGQIWRLWSPIFLHLGFLHLLFNMLWLKDLGSMIERHQSSWFLALQVLVIGALSNFAQYAMSGPNFGGMSGVVYGLLGYIWIREKYDPTTRLSLNQGVVTMMIFWFVLCLTGVMGPVANWAHGAGLATGMLWGYLAAIKRA